VCGELASDKLDATDCLEVRPQGLERQCLDRDLCIEPEGLDAGQTFERHPAAFGEARIGGETEGAAGFGTKLADVQVHRFC